MVHPLIKHIPHHHKDAQLQQMEMVINLCDILTKDLDWETAAANRPCTWSCGTKSAMLSYMLLLRQTSKTKQFTPVKLDFLLF